MPTFELSEAYLLHSCPYFRYPDACSRMSDTCSRMSDAYLLHSYPYFRHPDACSRMSCANSLHPDACSRMSCANSLHPDACSRLSYANSLHLDACSQHRRGSVGYFIFLIPRERFDWIELCGLFCRKISKNNTRQESKSEGNEYRGNCKNNTPTGKR